jgi:hypothetical protein
VNDGLVGAGLVLAVMLLTRREASVALAGLADLDVPRQWDRWAWNVEMVPIDVVKKYEEVDRRENRAALDKLAESVAKDGFREPLIFTYYQEDRTVRLGEGHHRRLVAERLGETHVPVRVVRNTSDAKKGDRRYYAAVPAPRPPPERNGYVPGDLRPSDLGIEALDREAYERLAAARDALPPEIARLASSERIAEAFVAALTPRERATIHEALDLKRRGKLDTTSAFSHYARVALAKLSKAAGQE